MSKIKEIAILKMVASVEKKIMHRRMDFWLPFRVQTARKSPLKISISDNSHKEFDRDEMLKEKGRSIVENIQ